MVVDKIIHTAAGRQYEFADNATDWEKEAVREFGVESMDEVQDALDWRTAVDKLPTEPARALRGKDPETGNDIGRGRARRSGR